MKRIVLFLLLIIGSSYGFGQNLSGQWKGEFIDRSSAMVNWGGDKCEYVLDLEVKGTTVTGYSYTYFTEGAQRYYTICKLKGFVDKKNKYVEVTETERTKTNVPVTIRNCFQTHKLTYSKIEDNEILDGSWVPAPAQTGDCGFGLTSLNRRSLKQSFPNFNANAARTPLKTPKPKTSTAVVAKKTTKPPPVHITTKKPVIKTPEKDPNLAKAPTENIVLKPNNNSVLLENEPMAPISIPKINSPKIQFEKRNNTLLKTLVVDSDVIKVELYDNGEIDGDSISLFYNNKLILSKKRLSDKAITLELPISNEVEINELVMFAENLGTIPPNTALMVVTDGKKRYEVRITSDLQKSGTIRFVHKNSNE